MRFSSFFPFFDSPAFYFKCPLLPCALAFLRSSPFHSNLPTTLHACKAERIAIHSLFRVRLLPFPGGMRTVSLFQFFFNPTLKSFCQFLLSPFGLPPPGAIQLDVHHSYPPCVFGIGLFPAPWGLRAPVKFLSRPIAPCSSLSLCGLPFNPTLKTFRYIPNGFVGYTFP